MSETSTRPGLAMIAIDSGCDLETLQARYSATTLPAAAAVTGVLAATQWQVTGRYTTGPDGSQVLVPAPRDYVVAYELEDVAVARSDAFLDACGRDFRETVEVDGERVGYDPLMSVTLGQFRDHTDLGATATVAGAMMVVSITVPREYEDLLGAWYDREHIGELMSCPGFLRTRRYKALDGIPSYFANYELDSVDALRSERFLHFSGRQFDEFPPIQQQVGPHMTQNICDIYERIG